MLFVMFWLNTKFHRLCTDHYLNLYCTLSESGEEWIMTLKGKQFLQVLSVKLARF